MLDPLLAELPAQLDELAIAVRGEVDEALERAFELDAHAVEARYGFEQLELRAAHRVTGLLIAVAILGAGGRALGLVLGDSRLVLELGQQRRQLSDLADDSAHAWKLVVRLVHRVGTEPLHGSKIIPMRSTLHRMETAEATSRLADSTVARLATVSDEGRPHIVPIVFALDGDTLYFAVDAKPKRTTNLTRLKNIARNPAVSVLVDHYQDDWTRLWWVRADGTARIVTDGAETHHAIELLTRRYPQYREARPPGPVVAIHIHRLSGWSAAP
jgi:PPOX class probable F420-dependent enzyme